MTTELNSTPLPTEPTPEQLRDTRLCAAVAKARAAAGCEDLWHLEAGPIDIIFRAPDEKTFQRATGKSAEDKRKAPEAMKELALSVVVYPEIAEFREICRKYPGVVMKVAADALAIASLDDAEFAKKV